MEIRVLGALEVIDAGGPVQVSAAKQRRLLAALLIRAGQACPSDLLIDAVWDGSPPVSAGKLLQLYISQLRKVLPAPACIRTRGAGYAVEVEGERVDAVRFERLAGEGMAALRDGNPALAASLLRRGLGLWRGPAYGDLGYERFARSEAERLEELRLVAVEERLEAELALGRHKQVLPELQSLAAAEPLRERLSAQAMLALYRCGRQAQALEVYASARARLRDDLGLEPGPELRRLQRRILQHDPALRPAPSSEMMAALPAPPNRLLGRERELAELHELLLRDDVRLVVLAGAGGCGKTRLAVAAARHAAASFANGAVFAELAPLRHPGQVIPAIWQALRLPEPAGDAGALAAALSPREQLLVLDSAEHVRAAGPALAGLLAQAPRLRLLVTSRVVLHLTGEHVYPVEPLRQEDAVLLFLERAREADPHLRLGPTDDQAVREICRRLDGLPLAIELAAGRLRAISPPELLGRLDPRLPLLTGGPADLPARQLTMRATIEWSAGLLDAQQRRDLCRLSVFAGGATLAAAEAVCGVTLERLSVLLDHNLIHRSATTAGSRYLMLETIREYAAEQLRAHGEAEQIARRHLRFLAAQAEPANLSAEAEGPQDFGAIIPEHQNARAAIEWAITAGEAELGLRLAIALENFWVTQNPFEGINLFTRLLAEAGTALPAVLRGRALRAWAGSAQLAGQPEQAQRLYEQSLTIFRALGDDQGIAILTYRLGLLALELGHPRRARPLLEQSRAAFEAIGSRRGQAQTIGAFGSLAHAEGNTALAATLYQHSAALAGQIGRTWWQARMLTKLADVALADEQYQDVTQWARQALLLARQIGNRQTIVYALAQLAAAAAAKNDPWRAGRLWGAIEADEARAPIGIWESAREPLAYRVLGLATPELERGLQQGRCFSLDEAVADALEADPPEHTRP